MDNNTMDIAGEFCIGGEPQDEICKNAILLNADKYQYFWKNKAKIIEAVYFYVSLLKLDNEVFPIEIIIEKRIKSKKESFHLIISTEKN